MTEADLKAELQRRAESMKARVDALQSEVRASGQALRERTVRNPLLAVGGALAAGLLVGLVFGGRKRSRTGEEAHRALVERYVAALVDEVRHAVASGADADEAVERALRDRVPLIIYTPDGTEARPGLIRTVFDLAFKTALGFGVKAVSDYFAARLDLVELQEEKLEREMGVPGSPPAAAADFDGPGME